jgi:hypothetical protein
MLATIRLRLINILSQSKDAMHASRLQELYKKAHGSSVEHKAVGFPKFNSLLKSIPDLEVRRQPGHDYWMVKIVTMGIPNKSVTPTDSTAKKQGQAHLMLPTIRLRLINILFQSKGAIRASRLQEVYKKAHGSFVNHKAVGFPKFISLLDSIPDLEIRDHKGLYYGVVETATIGIPDKCITPTDPIAKEQVQAQVGEFVLSMHRAKPKGELNPTISPVDQGTTVETYAPSVTMPTMESLIQSPDLQVTKQRSNVHDMTGPIPLFLSHCGVQSGERTNRYGLKLSNADGATSDFREYCLLGHLGLERGGERVFMNTHEPFCFAAIGVQGAGKSHTLGCVLESCLLPFDLEGWFCLDKAMTTLVLHYDQNTASVCEAIGLLSPSVSMLGETCQVPKSAAVVLVSPSYYEQRRAFYGDHCTVRPLLFEWESLTADHIKRIMRVQETDNQLYVSSFLNLLRKYQRRAVVPKFDDFIAEVRKVCCVRGQSGPLDQRIALLESVVAESAMNRGIRQESFDLLKAVNSGKVVVVADLTDPLLSRDEVNGLFQVLTEQFRAMPLKNGKLLALDEAHKFMDGVKGDGLSEAIVNVARLMRHDGMRLAVSTQSPKALAPELLELVTVAALHHFHSQDWWTYLKTKLPLADAAWKQILALDPGNALVFASRHNLPIQDVGANVLHVCIRHRLTADRGASKTN